MMNRYSRIAGTGSYLPEKVLTNADLEKLVDTNDEWIRTRTGIERRHIAASDETSSSMAEHAARRALKAAGQTPADVDFIVVGTTTPDLVFPNTATLLQQRLDADEAQREIAFALRLIVAEVEAGAKVGARAVDDHQPCPVGIGIFDGVEQRFHQ